MSVLGDDILAFDRDGALAETHAAAEVRTRSAFLRTAAVGAVGAVVLATADGAQAATANDVAILNYALVLEYLQAAFYTETERAGAVRGPARRAVRTIGAVERAHVRAFQQTLGRAAVARPFFDFRGTTEDRDAFLRTAVAFEDLAIAAYAGQAPLLDSAAVRGAAASILTVEARHAAWIRFLAGVIPASEALDQPKTKRQVRRIVGATRFITAAPQTSGRGSPRFTG